MRKVLRTELFRLARRVQRIREEQQRLRHGRGFGGQQSRLTSAIRMPAEDDTSRRNLAHGVGGLTQSFAIAGRCAGKRRSGGTQLAIGKIAAQDVKSRLRKCLCHGA